MSSYHKEQTMERDIQSVKKADLPKSVKFIY